MTDSNSDTAPEETPEDVMRAILGLESALIDLRCATTALDDMARALLDAGSDDVSGRTVMHFADTFRAIHERLDDGFKTAHQLARDTRAPPV